MQLFALIGPERFCTVQTEQRSVLQTIILLGPAHKSEPSCTVVQAWRHIYACAPSGLSLCDCYLSRHRTIHVQYRAIQSISELHESDIKCSVDYHTMHACVMGLILVGCKSTLTDLRTVCR